MADLKGNIFITTDVLCGWNGRTINGRQPIRIGGKNFRYLSAGVASELSSRYQIFIIHKASFPPDVGLICLNTLKIESKNAANEFVFWEDMTSVEIADSLDGTITTLFEYNPVMTTYAYIDTVRIPSIDAIIQDHRSMGIRNAGLCISRSIGYTQEDHDMLYNMADLPSPLFSKVYKNEYDGVSSTKSGKASNTKVAGAKAGQEMLHMHPRDFRRNLPFWM